MKIVRTYVPNSTANYNHLVYCPVTRQAAAIDPYDADHLIQIAQDHKLDIKQIWITHEHGDHIRHLNQLREITHATVSAPINCKSLFDADVWLKDLQNVLLGNRSVVHHLTPGHTPGHGLFTFRDIENPNDDFVVCGDTLFNAGVGNVYSGNVDELHDTIQRLSTLLTPTTKVYSGHDYMVTNLKFTLSHIPNLIPAKDLLSSCEQQSPDNRTVTSWSLENEINLFLMLGSPVLNSAIGKFNSNREQFAALRKSRNNW